MVGCSWESFHSARWLLDDVEPLTENRENHREREPQHAQNINVFSTLCITSAMKMKMKMKSSDSLRSDTQYVSYLFPSPGFLSSPPSLHFFFFFAPSLRRPPSQILRVAEISVLRVTAPEGRQSFVEVFFRCEAFAASSLQDAVFTKISPLTRGLSFQNKPVSLKRVLSLFAFTWNSDAGSSVSPCGSFTLRVRDLLRATGSGGGSGPTNPPDHATQSTGPGLILTSTRILRSTSSWILLVPNTTSPRPHEDNPDLDSLRPHEGNTDLD
ncbi:hypothetical protein EYF80_053699 [Liparis tanakae]|uniref:Uncharacterized protein n=1 Tax=Liparis tanakae TaxID=230148 RepID=A0A4Z2F4Q3_9TELE|nr:hypothetical protein EYF80_053699 [Liparis tanakae]